MVIEYQIKRIDVVKVYFYNLRHSPRTQLIVFGFAIFILVERLIVRHNSIGRLNVSDYLTAFLWGFAVVLFVPAANFVLAKTQKRTLSIDPHGIKTRIGAKVGTIPWTAVDKITDANERIIITGKNANTFTIPMSAFVSKEQRTEFLNLVTQYHKESKIS